MDHCHFRIIRLAGFVVQRGRTIFPAFVTVHGSAANSTAASATDPTGITTVSPSVRDVAGALTADIGEIRLKLID